MMDHNSSFFWKLAVIQQFVIDKFGKVRGFVDYWLKICLIDEENEFILPSDWLDQVDLPRIDVCELVRNFAFPVSNLVKNYLISEILLFLNC